MLHSPEEIFLDAAHLFVEKSQGVRDEDLLTGTPSRPLSFADIECKFQALFTHAGQPISPANAARLVDAVGRLEDLEDATDLIGFALQD